MAELLGKDHDNFDDADDEDLDLDRYDSAAGWDGSDAPEGNAHDSEANPANTTNATNKDRYAHRLPYLPHESMFEVRPANAVMRTEPPVDLVPGLWRTGELALLIGEPGIGKSLLAVQIAESIARGVGVLAALPTHAAAPAVSKSSQSIRTPRSALRTQKVLLLDLDQTDAQFAERYTCPSPIPGKLPVRYRFSPKLIRPSYRDFGSIPAEFNDSLTKFFDASIDQAITESGAKVIIIDNLAALTPYARNNSAHIRMLNSLKLTATTRNLSILVLHTAKPQKPRSQRSVARSSGFPFDIQNSTFEIADSVFSLCPTTFGPEYRYIKLLKTKQVDNGQLITESLSQNSPDRSLSTDHYPLSTDVPVFQLGKSPTPFTTEPTESAETALVPMIPHSAIRTPHSPGPFLGFEYLGPASESDLTRDYAAEANEAKRLHEQERKRLSKRCSKEILVDGILDGSYGRYLKGE
jgi:hypothetical protein